MYAKDVVGWNLKLIATHVQHTCIHYRNIIVMSKLMVQDILLITGRNSFPWKCILRRCVAIVLLSKQWNYRRKKQNKEADVHCAVKQDTYDDKISSYADVNDPDYQVSWDTDGWDDGEKIDGDNDVVCFKLFQAYLASEKRKDQRRQHDDAFVAHSGEQPDFSPLWFTLDLRSYNTNATQKCAIFFGFQWIIRSPYDSNKDVNKE